MRIVRVRSTTYERSQLHLRAANYASYLGETGADGAARRAARPRPLHDRPAGRRRHRARGRAAVRRAAARDQPGRLPRDRGARSSGSSTRSSSERCGRLVGLYLRRADRVVAIGETMKLRLVQKGAARGADRGDPELGRHDRARAAAAPERLVGGAGARRRVRRHALGQHRSRPGPRHARARGDVPPRPRAGCGSW